MSIVNMRKLNLVAMSYDKDAILNALHRTNAAEVTLHEETENTAIPVGEQEGLVSRLSVTEAALFSLSSFVSQYEKDNNIKSDLLKDGFDVSYSEFVAAGSLYETVDGLVLHINELVDEKNRLKAELASIVKEKNSANIYRALSLPFDRFQDTAHTRGKLGEI